MAQTICDTSTLLPAMASPLTSIDPAKVSIQDLGLLSDGNILLAPSHNGRKIILDLTPGDDDWLEVLTSDSEAFAHLEGEATQALHFGVRLNEADIAKLDAIEKNIQKIMGYSVILKLVVSNSVAPTSLLFLQGDAFK